MTVFRAVLVVTLLGSVGCQEDVLRGYGQYGGGQRLPSYRATPRLVPLKVRSDLNALNYPTMRQASTMTRHIRVPRPHQVIQGKEPVRTVKRVRVVPSGPVYASTLEQPVEFRHTVPAVATYKVAAPYSPQPQQGGYYVPRRVEDQRRPLLKVQNPKGELEAQEEYPSDVNPQYNFAFDVKDDDLTNYQNRQESRDNGVVKGSYSVVDPDGYVRTVTYEATPKGGFKAKVTREPTDVKIKFPVPTEAPEEKKAPQGQYQQPIYQQSYSPEGQYGGGAQYVARRFPQQQRQLPRYSQ